MLVRIANRVDPDLGLCCLAGIIFGGDCERFALFSAKNLIEIGLMGEKFHSKM